MIYLELLLSFLKIGLFSFGGAYGAIPLIRQEVLARGWMDEILFSNILAISESTPGPIMLNLATYVGSMQGGIGGSLIASLGVVLPSFVIILLIAIFLQKFVKNKYVQAVLKGVKLSVIGIIIATGLYMIYSAFFNNVDHFFYDYISVIILLILGLSYYIYLKIKKKKMSSIMLIVIAGFLGAFLYI